MYLISCRCIDGGDETMPVVDASSFWDHYSRTKAQAETMVLQANGMQLKNTKTQAMDDVANAHNTAAMPGSPDPQPVTRSTAVKAATAAGSSETTYSSVGLETNHRVQSAVLRTCAIRPAGIYGPGESRHLPRVVSMVIIVICISQNPPLW
jgi:nucleoside-diphosphate-sugar epimerase